jgi:hypothetical protein
MINQELIRLFVESTQCKDCGLLKSALEKRRQAGDISRGKPGDYALAKANEAVLLGFHIGDGIGAYEAAKESLKDINSLKQASREWQTTVMAFSPFEDVLCFIINWAESYVEAISYSKLAEDHFDTHEKRSRAKITTESLIKMQNSGKKWWEAQFIIANQFYSRSVQAEDAGKNAAGMAVLHCILERAEREMPGYDMDASKAFDILDDYICLAQEAYIEIAGRFQRALPNEPSLRYVDGAAEQHIIFANPLKIWLELMDEWSECPVDYRLIFQKRYEILKSSPFPILPELLDKLTPYFHDVKIKTKICSSCGYENSFATSICIKCMHPFNDAKTSINFTGNDVSGNLNQQPITISQTPGYSIVIVTIGLAASISLWWWAVGQENANWFGVIIAVFVSLYTLNQLPFHIKNIFRKKK